MRVFLSSLLLFISYFGSAQSALDKKFSEDVCHCLTQHTISSSSDFQNCYLTAINQNYALVTKESKLFTDTSGKYRHTFANQMYDRISVAMIATCKPYYNLIDTWRYTEMLGVNKDSIRSEISKMNNNSVYGRDEIFYTNRGMMYFKISDLENALNDFNKAIQLNSNALQSLIFKAWVLELNKDYDQAYTLYTSLALLTGKNEFNVLAAMVRQKQINEIER